MSRIGPNVIINVGGAIVPSSSTIPAYLHLIGEAQYGVLGPRLGVLD